MKKRIRAVVVVLAAIALICAYNLLLSLTIRSSPSTTEWDGAPLVVVPPPPPTSATDDDVGSDGVSAKGVPFHTNNNANDNNKKRRTKFRQRDLKTKWIENFQRQQTKHLRAGQQQQQTKEAAKKERMKVLMILNQTKLEELQPRAFLSWNEIRGEQHPLPCFHPTDGNSFIDVFDKKNNLKLPAKTGLFYLKLLKTASSTAASVHLRIARNLATKSSNTNTKNFPICKTRHLHGWASRTYQFDERLRSQSFLWTTLREPVSRYISEFFHFRVSRHGIRPTDANFQKFLKNGTHSDHHSISWLSTVRYNYKRDNHRAYALNYAQHILDHYDFIGTSERFDESLVALSMLLHLKLTDILYISTKAAGGYDDGEHKDTCFLIKKSFVSPGMQEFFDHDPWWLEYVHPEMLFYNAANFCLDLTIDRLGRAEFLRNLQRFRHAQTIVEERCHPVMPCSSNGQKTDETDCLQGDLGCGFDCLDQVAIELDLR